MQIAIAVFTNDKQLVRQLRNELAAGTSLETYDDVGKTWRNVWRSKNPLKGFVIDMRHPKAIRLLEYLDLLRRTFGVIVLTADLHQHATVDQDIEVDAKFLATTLQPNLVIQAMDNTIAKKQKERA